MTRLTPHHPRRPLRSWYPGVDPGSPTVSQMLPDHLILASASPRRLDLLHQVGLDPEVRIPDVDETPLAGEDAASTVERLACAKRDAVAGEGEWVVAADTVVVVDGEALGKPGTPEKATAMLRLLSGRSHQVLTGVAVAGPVGRTSTTVCTEVTWRELSDDEVAAYVATGEPLDKAGGYGLQGGGASIFGHYCPLL